MNTNWKEWLQILSNIAILVGIIFVYWEIQQNQTLTRIQLVSDGMMMRADRANSLVGENPTLVLEKACLSPDELTTSDKMILAQIFQSRISEAARNRRLYLASDIGIQYENDFQMAFVSMFNYEFGRDYYERTKERLPPDLREIGDFVLNSEFSPNCKEGSSVPGGF